VILGAEAAEILARAQARARRTENSSVPVDFDALNKLVKRQRAQLTKALKNGSPDRVIVACRDAVRAWREPGMTWPDDWSRWQRALDDVLPPSEHVLLEDLS